MRTALGAALATIMAKGTHTVEENLLTAEERFENHDKSRRSVAANIRDLKQGR